MVLLSAAGGLLLVAAAWVGTVALAGAVVLLQLAVAASWHDLLRAPGARAGSLIGVVAGVGATAAVTVGDDGGSAGALAVLGVAGLFLAFAQQLVGGDEGAPRLAALTATTALVLVEVLASGWVSAGSAPVGGWVVAAGVAGTMVAVLAVATAGTATWVVVGVVLVSGGVGGLVGAFGPMELGPRSGAGVAATAGLAAVCGAQVRRLAGRSARTAPATVAALPLVLAGPATFIAARILVP